MGDASSAIFLNPDSSFLRLSSNIKASPAVNYRLFPPALRINTPFFLTLIVNLSVNVLFFRVAFRENASEALHPITPFSFPLNKEKSDVSEIKHVPFLGFQILRGKIRVSNKSRVKFKDKIRDLTRRNNPLSMCQIIQDLKKYLQGWVAYFGIQSRSGLPGRYEPFCRKGVVA